MNRRDLFRIAALTLASFLPSFGRTLKFPPSTRGTNTLLTSQMITNEALAVLQHDFCIFPKMFGAELDGVKIGDTVMIRKPPPWMSRSNEVMRATVVMVSGTDLEYTCQ